MASMTSSRAYVVKNVSMGLMVIAWTDLRKRCDILEAMKSFSWHSLEYIHREKGSDWFWVLGIAAGAIAITSIIFGNVLFAIVVIVGAFVLALYAARQPNMVAIEVNEKGVVVDRTLYPFKHLRSFWIDDEHKDGARLVLRSKKAIVPYIVVPIGHDDLDELRGFLESKLEAEPFEENPIHALFERLGF